MLVQRWCRGRCSFRVRDGSEVVVRLRCRGSEVAEVQREVQRSAEDEVQRRCSGGRRCRCKKILHLFRRDAVDHQSAEEVQRLQR